MGRLTKHEIEQSLLQGLKIEWKSASGEQEEIELGEARQRRLFEYLRKSDVREAKGLSSAFVTGLATAANGSADPAAEAITSATVGKTGPWRLRSIETKNFGGLNLFEGPEFTWDFDEESLILQGQNGSGKSSLVGAIIWAMTGERPRDHGNTSSVEPTKVFDTAGKVIGAWPPIASYPTDSAKLTDDPAVSVKLTFAAPDGTTASVERRLEKGSVTAHIDGALKIPNVFVETGLLMPARMAQIRLEGHQTPLTEAVQSLTGLDDLVEIGGLVEGLCHRSREYLATKDKEVRQARQLFDASLAEAKRALATTGEEIGAFAPADTADAEGAFAQIGKRLRARAEELTRAVSNDLSAVWISSRRRSKRISTRRSQWRKMRSQMHIRAFRPEGGLRNSMPHSTTQRSAPFSTRPIRQRRELPKRSSCASGDGATRDFA